MEEQQQSSIQQQDTRTHVVGELYDTERSYVESLQILTEKYMKPLKSYDSNKALIDSSLVDEIFYTIPEILQHHENFLSALQDRLSSDWDSSQVIGNVFIEAFTNQQIIDTYTAFINNWKNARHAIKLATQAKPAFERFLEAMSREHRNKLTLDALLIMPVQRIPRYELLIKELVKHTPEDHPDHGPLIEAQKQIHELALKIDRAEKEMIQQEQLRDIESLIEGHIELQHPQRDFIRYDLVTISASTTLAIAKKERVLFLFCDLLIMASVKKKVSRRSNLQAAFSSSYNDLSLLEGNKFRLLLKVSLDQIDVKHESRQSGEALAEQDYQSQHQRQKISNLINDKRREIEDDLVLLQQIESLSTRLNLTEGGDLIAIVNRLSNQARQDLVSLNYQRQQQNIEEIANHQDLSVIQQQPAQKAVNLLDLSQISNDQSDRQQQMASVSASSNNSNDNQNTSLEFVLINHQSVSSKEGIHTNLSSSSITSDHSLEQQQQQHQQQQQQIMSYHPPASGQNMDSSNSIINSNNVNQNISSNYESLVVTFMSAEKRQAFLQAFNEAKQARMEQQRSRHHHKLFGSSQTLRLSHDHSPVKARLYGLGGLSLGASSDGRRAKLRHQDEVDLRHLESLTAAIRNNRSSMSACALSSAHSSSAPHHATSANTIVHQMCPPQKLTAGQDGHSPVGGQPSDPGDNIAAAMAQRCDSYSSGCIIDTEYQQDKQLGLCRDEHQQSYHHYHHHHLHHHHHQLMHQPASQPALSVICCHDRHNDMGFMDSSLLADKQTGTDHQLKENYTEQHMRLNYSSNNNYNSNITGSLMDQISPRSSLTLATLGLQFAPKFMLTIPMNFLATQHPALQFTCSIGRKRPALQETAGALEHEGKLLCKSQTIQDDLGQFWLCMSNGYVSHVALISLRKRRVCTGSHGQPAPDASQQAARPCDEPPYDRPSFHCYDVIPVVQSGGDVCKSQINCAAHVGWSDAPAAGMQDRTSGSGGGRGERCADKMEIASRAHCDDEQQRADLITDASQRRESGFVGSRKEATVTVAVKSASPPTDFKCRTAPSRATKQSSGDGLSDSSGVIRDDGAEDEPLEQRLFARGTTAAPLLHGSDANDETGDGRLTNYLHAKIFHRQLSGDDDARNNSSCNRLESEIACASPRSSRRLQSHHHSHDYLRQSYLNHQHHHHHHHHHHFYSHQRSLSPTCSPSHQIGPRQLLGADDVARTDHRHRYLGQQQRGLHHHHQFHHHHHSLGHANRHDQAKHRQRQRNNGEQPLGISANVYSGKHHTVPLAELRRALERQKRIVVSDAEAEIGGRLTNDCATCSITAATLRSYNNKLAPPPSNTPYNFDNGSIESCNSGCSGNGVAAAVRRDSRTPAGGSAGGSSSELGCGALASALSDASIKKARSTTPPARYSTVSQKSFRSARMLRHQASLKTSSILAKLVGGATRSSSYLKRKNSAVLTHKVKQGNPAPSAERQSDLDDNDTDTDNSARALTANDKQRGEQDASSGESATVAQSGAGGLAVPSAARLKRRLSRHRQQQQQQRRHCELNAGSSPAVNAAASIVSPLSSASSLNSTNSSLTVNSECASVHGCARCTMMRHNSPCQPQWSSMNFCALGRASDGDNLQCSTVLDKSARLQQSDTGPDETGQCHIRARSATVPCRPACLQQGALRYPDSYLITKCSASNNNEQAHNIDSCLEQLKDDLLANHPTVGRAMIESSYKVSEIINDPNDSGVTRQVYHQGSIKELASRNISHDSVEAARLQNVVDRNSSLWMGCDDGSLIIIDCLAPQKAAPTSADKIEAALEQSAPPHQSNCRNIHCEIKLDASICDIKNCMDQMVFVALANGQLAVFTRQNQQHDQVLNVDDRTASIMARWSLKNPKILTMCQSETSCTAKLCLVEKRHQLWCSYGRYIYVLNVTSLDLDTTIVTPTDDKSISQLSMQQISIDHMELTECLDGIWVAFRGSPLIQFYDCATCKLLLEMSLLESISKVLSYGNEIIRQHKTACLGATSLLSVSASGRKEVNDNHNNNSRSSDSRSTSLFIGTTAGIIIYLDIGHKQLREHIEAEKSVWNPQVVSLRHGHSGQVKFLRLVEMESDDEDEDEDHDHDDHDDHDNDNDNFNYNYNDNDNDNNHDDHDVAKSVAVAAALVVSTEDAGASSRPYVPRATARNSDPNGGASRQLCLVSAGAGIDLYGPNNEQQVMQQLNGAEDCLNHMIIWQI